MNRKAKEEQERKEMEKKRMEDAEKAKLARCKYYKTINKHIIAISKKGHSFIVC